MAEAVRKTHAVWEAETAKATETAEAAEAVKDAKAAKTSRDRRGGGLVLEPAVAPVVHAGARRVTGMVVAAALFAGLGAAFVQASGLALTSAQTMMDCIVAAAVIIVSALLVDRGKVERNGLLAMLAAAIAVCAVFHGAFLDGGAQVLNSIADVIGSRTADFAVPYAASSPFGLTLFTCVFSGVLSAICAQMALRGNVVPCTLFALLVAVLICTGFVPVDFRTAILSAGVIGCFGMNAAMVDHLVDGRALIAGVSALLFMGAACVAIVLAFTGVGTIDTSTPRNAVMQIVYDLRYGNATFAMPQGRLHDLGALDASDRPALSVSTSAQTKEYLRGFVGEYYTDDTWGNLPDEAVKDSRGLFYWLDQDGFSTGSQLSDAAAYAGYQKLDPQSMTISYTGARGGYAYLPYAYTGGATLTTTTDQALTSVKTSSSGGSSDNASNIDMDGTLLRRSYLLQSTVTASQDGATGDLMTYLDDESAYRDFVYANYLTIPSDVASTFKSLYGDASQLSTEQAKALVLEELNQTVSYDATAATDNGDTDFVTYFLTESRTGYCVHYASAATLLMRYYGIPTRYVEGYLLDTTNDTTADAASGTSTDAAVGTSTDAASGSGERTDLTEADAHAWVEYYLDGVGWIPFEVTPGFVDYSFYDVTDRTSMQYTGNAWSVGESDEDSSWSPKVEDDEQQQDEEQAGVAGASTSGSMWLWALLGLAVVLIVALIARTVVLRHRLKVFLRGLGTDEPARAVPLAFSYGIYLGEQVLGLHLANEPYQRQADRAEEGRLCKATTFAAAADANARALYAQQGAGEDDRAVQLRFLDEVREGLNGQVNPFKRFFMRWVRCIY